MPSVRYYNQTAPFWDFIASMEEQGASHPLFAGNNRGAAAAAANNNDNDNNEPHQPNPNPWEGGWAGFPFGPMPHRGRHHGPPHHHHGPPPPPPPPGHAGPPPPPGHEGPPPPPPAGPEHDPEEGSSDPRGPPPPFPDESEHRGPPHHGPHGSHRGRCGGRGGRGGWGGRDRGGPWNWSNNTQHPLANLSGLAEMFQSQLFGGDNNATTTGNNTKDTAANSGDFTPEADVFDTATNYTIHLSLPGAAKSDIAVTWSEQTSSLTISGVVHRPGSEELLATLALDERKVGAFERSIRLGSRANPAQVDAEGITAKLEDGVLRVEVPKLDADYVEVKRVDVE